MSERDETFALRDDYTALNLAAISYSMLHTTGLALSSRPTADLAATHLRDLAGLVVRINQVMPQIVAHELRDEAENVDETVASVAVANINAAWQNL